VSRGGEGHGERGAARQAVARAWARTVVPRVKFTTGRPKPRFAKVVTGDGEAGRRRRQVDRLGVMVPTPGTTRVSIDREVDAAYQAVGHGSGLQIT